MFTLQHGYSRLGDTSVPAVWMPDIHPLCFRFFSTKHMTCQAAQMLRLIGYRLMTMAWRDPVSALVRHEMLRNFGNATISGLDAFGRQ